MKPPTEILIHIQLPEVDRLRARIDALTTHLQGMEARACDAEHALVRERQLADTWRRALAAALALHP